MREEFEKWAGKHQYLPIVERDFFACWQHAWEACEKSKQDEIHRLYKRVFYLELRLPTGDDDWMKNLK